MTGLQQPAISLRGVTKLFGATCALSDISLDVFPGEVHALVGENGAGKSTCLGLISGRIMATKGQVLVSGIPLKQGDPRASAAAGVAAIYQELEIAPALAAEANVFLGSPLSRAGFLRFSEMRSRYISLAKEVGVSAHPGVRAQDLSVADQQILEILRSQVREASIILFDEPSASLARAEKEALHRLIRRLRDVGTTILFVSHDLDEVLDLADRVTVFRNGELQATRPTADWDNASLVEAMIGRVVDTQAYVRAESRAAAVVREGEAPPVLQVSDLAVPGVLEGVSFTLHAGEILGVGGLVGSGRSTLLRCLSGLVPQAKGRMTIDGAEHRIPRTAVEALQYGIAMIPEDRKRLGLFAAMSSCENIVCADRRAVSQYGFVSRKASHSSAGKAAVRFGFDGQRLRHAVSTLSGGNQQKLLLARWGHRLPRVLLADEPTRGIDVGAKAEIVESLTSMADNGMGVILVSSDLEEVAALSDRAIVLAHGEQVTTLTRDGADITIERILQHAFQLDEVDTELAEHL